MSAGRIVMRLIEVLHQRTTTPPSVATYIGTLGSKPLSSASSGLRNRVLLGDMEVEDGKQSPSLSKRFTAQFSQNTMDIDDGDENK